MDLKGLSQKLLNLKRRKGREYHKKRKSVRWGKLDYEYQIELSKAKKNFYRKKIKHLRKANPGKWYNEFKKLTSYDQ